MWISFPVSINLNTKQIKKNKASNFKALRNKQQKTLRKLRNNAVKVEFAHFILFPDKPDAINSQQKSCLSLFLYLKFWSAKPRLPRQFSNLVSFVLSLAVFLPLPRSSKPPAPHDWKLAETTKSPTPCQPRLHTVYTLTALLGNKRFFE